MIEICKKSECTGCAACANRCPKLCIEMKPMGYMGHEYPYIDQSRCIDCGACKSVCPSIHPMEKRLAPFAYAGWDKNAQEYKSSTSGGAASAFSRHIIREGGVVYGCAMLDDIQCKHIRIDRLEDIYKLKGSKYVQSSIGLIYKEMLSDLKSNRKVLFIGTPCQVAGAIKMAGKYRKELYAVDLICHGCPSLLFLRKHILKVTKGVIPDEIYFRKGNYLLLLLLLLGREIYRSDLFKERYKDIYYNTFFDGYSYRESCYTCQYARPERASDVTIGDFWGLNDNLPINHPYGCSVLLPNTENGLHLVEAIEKDFHLFKREVSEAVKGNDQLRTPKYKNRRIRLFKNISPLLGIGFAYRLCVCDKMVLMIYRKTKSRIKKTILKA